MSDNNVSRDEFSDLRMRVTALEITVQRLQQPRHTGRPISVPLPPDNTRSIEEILDMLTELRERWRRWDEEHP